MKYRLSKAAIIGPAYYYCVMIFMIFPFTFTKSNTGAEFRVRPRRVIMHVILWLSLCTCFVMNYAPSSVMIWFNIIISVSYPVIYGKEIIRCYNSSYSLLRQTKYKHNIFIPLFFIFSPSILCITSFIRSLGPPVYFNLFISLIIYALESSICSLCYAVIFVLRDIYLQLEHGDFSSTRLQSLAQVQYRTYQLAGLISEAFGCFLFLNLIADCAWLLKHIIILSKIHTVFFFTSYFPSFGLSLIVICVCSSKMNQASSRLLVIIEERMSETECSSEDYKTFEIMVQQIMLNDLHISCLGCFQLDLSFLFSLASAVVTFLVVLWKKAQKDKI